MSKPKHYKRGTGYYIGYGYSSTELNATKGLLCYRVHLQECRQAEIKKQYFSQDRSSVKVTGAKRARLVKLARYQMFVDRGSK